MMKKTLAALSFLMVLGASPAMSLADEADVGLTAEQKTLIVDEIKSMSPEERKQLRHDENARRSFIGRITREMEPDQRRDFRQRWRSMSAEERRQMFEEAREEQAAKKQQAGE